MALVVCAECGGISDSAAGLCPNCGQKLSRKAYLTRIAALAALLALGALMFYGWSRFEKPLDHEAPASVAVDEHPASPEVLATLSTAAPSAAEQLQVPDVTPSPTSVAVKAEDQTDLKVWAVQIGLFSTRENAARLLQKLRTKGLSAVMTGSAGGRFRVRIAALSDRGSAERSAAIVKSDGFPAVVINAAN